MKFRTKIIMGNGLTLAMLLLIGLVVYFSVNSLLENTKWVEHTYQVIGKANQLGSYMIDQETGMRGFAVSGQEDYLEPYNNGKSKFKDLIQEQQNTVSDNPAQVKRLKNIEDLTEEWRTKVANKFIELRREIKAGEDLENEIQSIIKSGVGKRNMDNFRSLLKGSGVSQSGKDQILLDMINMETGLRGYLLNEEEEYLEPYVEGKQALETHFAQYGASKRIQNAADDWVTDYADKLVELQRKEALTADMSLLYEEFAKQEGKKYMDKIRSELAEFENVEAALLETRMAKQESTAITSKLVITLGTLAAFIIGVVIIYWVTSSVMNQLGGEPSEVANIAALVANGKLDMNFDQSKQYKGLLGNMKDMVFKLREIVTDVMTGAKNISSASYQMSSTSQQMSQGANVQASSAEEVSSSMEEMTANIQQNTDNAQQTEKIALKAANDVLNGSTAVNQTVDSMKSIAEKITIIGEIARQTNILALNAAVEAARAGEHGKGFAVVAAEVRKLAERSQAAAVEIDQVSKSSVEVAEKSGKLLAEIVPDIQKTAKLVQEISAASIEQNSGAEQVNTAIQQLNQVTQQNAAASEEMATGSEELAGQAEQLMTTITYFKVGEETYKNKNKKASFEGQKLTEQVAHIKKESNKSHSSNVHGVKINMEDEHDNNYEKF